jgi:hypothetical protein
MLPINMSGIFDSLRSPGESIFESVTSAKPDIAGLFEPGAEVSLNPQPLPPAELFASERFGDEVALNPQPLPPIGESRLQFAQFNEEAAQFLPRGDDEISQNPQPLPPIGVAAEDVDFGLMFEDAEMDFGREGDEVELNSQPLPPIGEVEPEFRTPVQFAAENDAMLKSGERDFEFLAPDRAVSSPDFDVEPLQLDPASQPAFDASAFQANMMVQ